jgi:hypothetical protein
LNGYLPTGWTLEQAEEYRASDPAKIISAAKKSMALHVEAMLAFYYQGIPTFDYGNNIREMALLEAVENAGYVTAIELLSAIRAVAFHLPLKTSERLEKIIKQLSPLIQLDSSDHVLSPEIEALQQAVLGGRVATVVLEIDGKPNFHDCSQIGKSG